VDTGKETGPCPDVTASATESLPVEENCGSFP